jgi:glycoside/pentoside/hexuronide:cation symporter, GPH family
MTTPTHPTPDLPWQASDGVRYGFMGLPLAFVALPLYVHLPNYYATQFGMSLALLGVLLLVARVFDAVTDPLLGRLTDRGFGVSNARVRHMAAVAGVLLVLGMTGLWFPMVSSAYLPAWLLGGMLLTTAAYSQLQISHQSWAARLGGTEGWRTRIVAWREGYALVGVVLASVLPSMVGWSGWLTVFVVAIVLGLYGWSRALQPTRAASTAPPASMLLPWQRPLFKKLMWVFVLSGMASAMPATLVLFFIQDLLQARAWEPLFLSLYFVSAAASMPLWVRAVRHVGLARAWLGGMLLAVVTFVWAGTLGAGDVVAYAVICALSGLALGADLAIPTALLAGIIGQHNDQGHAEGAYFGWWNLASKLNLALAAGVALPMLGFLGYSPGLSDPSGLQALTLAYAVLPCVLKLIAAVALYRFFIQTPPLQRT